eukprot:1430-Eustigmatos_ZCMA.PRE.1
MGQRCNGRHARGEGHRLIGPFQGRQPLLEGLHRGVGEARVHVAGLLAAEARGRLGRRTEHVGRGHGDGLAMAVGQILVLRRANGAGHG